MIRPFPKPATIIPPGRLYWGDEMTLCVAAQCWYQDKRQVVFAADRSVETEFARAEIEIKTMTVCEEEFPVMIAGSASRARELITHIHWLWKDSRESDELSRDNFIDICRRAVQKHKFSLASEYVGAMLGVSYSELLESKHSAIPEDQYRELMFDIGRMKLGCQLLMAYFADDESLLVRISDDGIVEVCNNFAAIGSGLTLAEGSLFQREHAKWTSLADTIYHVYEAMRIGARGPGVGDKFMMMVARYDEQQKLAIWSLITSQYHRFLATEFDKFGPKTVRGSQVLQANLISTMPRNDRRRSRPDKGANAKSAGEGS